MLQINNSEGKSDWINETHLIIPMVENEEITGKEMEGIHKHTITLNGLEGGDQTLLANGSGQTFVIGLDQALFENYNSKSDLLLMSNADLKLLPTVSDSKLAYTLPSIDHPKSEIVWENNTFEKPLTKDILNVIQDATKGWQDMGKNGEICLDDIHSVEVHDSKLNADFMMEPHMIQSKKLRTDGSDQYLIGYYPVVEACDTVLVPASLMTLQPKIIDNEPTETMVLEKNVINSSKNLSQLFGTENMESTQTGKWLKSGVNVGIEENLDKIDQQGRSPVLKINNNNTLGNSSVLTHENVNNSSETVIPLINSSTSDVIDTKSKNDINVNDTVQRMTKDKRFDAKSLESENGSLPEQSLPLKKKAKMKKSPVGGSFSFSSDPSVQGFTDAHEDKGEEEEERSSSTCHENKRNSDSEEVRRRRKNEGTLQNLKKKRKEVSESESGKCNYRKEVNAEEGDQDDMRYVNIIQLLEQLKNEKYINEAVFRILRTGLEEMDVDVLEEMYCKRNDKCPEYSSHLKAFALMLHFKQPSAFNRLGELFHNGWPPLSVIKEWKRQLNNNRKEKKIK